MAAPTVTVSALPPRSGVRGPPSPRQASIAAMTAGGNPVMGHAGGTRRAVAAEQDAEQAENRQQQRENDVNQAHVQS